MNFKLLGSYSRVEIVHGMRMQNEELFNQYEDHFVFNYDIPRESAKHLIHSYGTTSLRVVELGEKEKLNIRLHPSHSFLKSEVLYAVRHEMAEKPNDILCRRVPIGVLDSNAAAEVVKTVVEIMAKEKKWSANRKKEETEEALRNLPYIN